MIGFGRHVLRLCCGMLVCLVASCGPQAQLTPTSLTSSMTPREPACKIDWYEKGAEMPKQFGDLGEIHASEDRIIPRRCNKGRVREALRRAACEAGADAAVIISERKPNTLLNCWRVEARLIKYGDLPSSLPLIHKAPPPLGGLPANIRKYRRETPPAAKGE